MSRINKQYNKPYNLLEENKTLLEQYLKVRSTTEDICGHLQPEDTVIQTMKDVSPPKWHLGHTTWFFEAFLLIPFSDAYRIHNESFHELFNSYYKKMGNHILQLDRGFLSRPLLKEIYSYRNKVDEAIQKLLSNETKSSKKIQNILELGLHHEQQHQELLLTDIKHIFFSNPTLPIYQPSSVVNTKQNIKYVHNERPFSSNKKQPTRNKSREQNYAQFEGGLSAIGNQSDNFGYDNEFPQHKHYLNPFLLQKNTVSNQEYLNFIEDGGYQRSEHWLSDGWDVIQKEKWKAPLYWIQKDRSWYEYRLKSLSKVDPNSPVCHVSFFEADAFARWSGKRIPTEFEWEFACKKLNTEKKQEKRNYLESKLLHPIVENQSNDFLHILGNLWEWTNSSYLPYPGFKPLTGALGEYNGKFMNSQRVLRGGSCLTPTSHIRPTYRNFLQPQKRWQCTGIRLAADP